MRRRWVWRGLAVGVVVLCLSGWVGSCFRGVLVMHRGGNELIWVRVEGGVVGSGCRTSLISSFLFPEGWSVSGYASAPGGAFRLHFLDGAFLGFVVRHLADVGGVPNWEVVVPMWFPTMLAAVGAWVAWRRTGKKEDGRGFGVEGVGEGFQGRQAGGTKEVGSHEITKSRRGRR